MEKSELKNLNNSRKSKGTVLFVVAVVVSIVALTGWTIVLHTRLLTLEGLVVTEVTYSPTVSIY